MSVRQGRQASGREIPSSKEEGPKKQVPKPTDPDPQTRILELEEKLAEMVREREEGKRRRGR